MKIVNRGWLKRQVEAGMVEAKCNYLLTDDYAGDKANNFAKTDWMPARIRRNYNDFVLGQINLWGHDFKCKPGGAWREDDGTITLIVHSNLSYSLRLIKERK